MNNFDIWQKFHGKLFFIKTSTILVKLIDLTFSVFQPPNILILLSSVMIRLIIPIVTTIENIIIVKEICLSLVCRWDASSIIKTDSSLRKYNTTTPLKNLRFSITMMHQILKQKVLLMKWQLLYLDRQIQFYFLLQTF